MTNKNANLFNTRESNTMMRISTDLIIEEVIRNRKEHRVGSIF